MGLVANFLISLAVAGVIISAGSLAWPRLTNQPRPKLLQDVRNVVIKTPLGAQTANVLGVSDESRVTLINVGQATSSIAGQVKSAVQDRIQAIVVGNAVNQLHQQFERLSPDQKTQIQQIICKPLENK